MELYYAFNKAIETSLNKDWKNALEVEAKYKDS